MGRHILFGVLAAVAVLVVTGAAGGAGTGTVGPSVGAFRALVSAL
jgi:hypothetical protein